MRNTKLITAGLVMLAFAGAVLARDRSAHAAAGGTIEGRVVDRSGTPIPAHVIVTPAQGGLSVHAESGRDGRFRVTGLVDDTYRLDVELRGFDLTRVNHVRVRSETATSVQAVMQLSSLCECLVSGLRTKVALAGQVVDSLGRPLPHARLSLDHPHSWTESTYADAEGRFLAYTPAEGAFEIKATDSGFDTATHPLTDATEGAIQLTLRPIGLRGVPPTERFVHGCGCPDLLDVEKR